MNRRSRVAVFMLMILVMAAALATRWDRAAFLPEFVKTYGGDTLWAAALYLFVALLRPSAAPVELFLTTVLLSVLVEVSQLYQADWANRLRHTFPLGYVLGYGFKWSDLICYTFGALMSFGFDSWDRSRRSF